MWGFWAGSHWQGPDAAIVDLDWTVNAAGQRYQALRSEWTTAADGSTNANGEFDFRGFHGTYDITLTPPGGTPVTEQFVLSPGSGIEVVTITVAHGEGSGIPDDCECIADLDGDGAVDVGDFLLVLAGWGPCSPECPADIDGDGNVGITDFLRLVADWGPCP
jgi:hypothetical protein